VVGGRCPECGEGVERPRHLEVWRDPEAVEELVPVQDVESGQGASFRSYPAYRAESRIGQVTVYQPKGVTTFTVFVTFNPPISYYPSPSASGDCRKVG